MKASTAPPIVPFIHQTFHRWWSMLEGDVSSTWAVQGPEAQRLWVGLVLWV